MANENMKNPFRLLLNMLHRLLDDKADTEYVDQRIDEAGKDVSLGISEAVVGQTVKITEVDENGKPTNWEAVEMASGGASSWNDLTDKPFGSGMGKLDIIPEQQVTFSDGVARLISWKDPCYDLGLVSDPGTMTAILEINGETIESELKYYYVATGTFGAYTVNLGAETITLGDGATVQDGETVTVRMYIMSEIVETLDPKFLPENAAMAVSYSRNQTLTEYEQNVARTNIGAAQSIEYVVAQDWGEITAEGLSIEIPDNVNYHAFGTVLISVYLYDPNSFYDSIRSVAKTTAFFNTDGLPNVVTLKLCDDTKIFEVTLLVKFSEDDLTLTVLLLNGVEGYEIRLKELSVLKMEQYYI